MLFALTFALASVVLVLLIGASVWLAKLSSRVSAMRGATKARITSQSTPDITSSANVIHAYRVYVDASRSAPNDCTNMYVSLAHGQGKSLRDRAAHLLSSATSNGEKVHILMKDALAFLGGVHDTDDGFAVLSLTDPKHVVLPGANAIASGASVCTLLSQGPRGPRGPQAGHSDGRLLSQIVWVFAV
jgi:hypothetical protein